MKANVRVFILSFFLALPLGAQTRFEEKVEEDFWLQSRNISGIREIPFYSARRGISFAELRAGIESGRFHDPSDADLAYGAGVRAGTLVHLPKTSMLGTFSFSERRGDGMCGSMFITPGSYPFDLFEFTPGGKTLQTYAFTGGLAHTLSQAWTIGSKMSFESANYAKKKDIRHTNYRLDLSVEPSVLYRHDDYRLGASLLLRKQSESVSAEQIGSATADSYFAFLDKGLFYGTSQVWNGSGIHLAETGLNRFPVTILSYGGALQASLMEKLCGEVAYVRSEGEAGEKGFTWFRFPENTLSAMVEFRWGGSITQWVRIRYEGRSLSNYETVLDRVTSGGITLPVIYGENRIYRERKDRLSMETEGITHGGSGFLLHLAAARYDRRSFLMFPYYARSREVLAEGNFSIWHSFGPWRMTLGANFRSSLFDKDSLEMLPDGGTAAGSEPYRLTEWYLPSHEFRLAPRCGLRLAARYNFGKGFYAEGEGSLVRGSRLAYLDGRARMMGGLHFGLEF